MISLKYIEEYFKKRNDEIEKRIRQNKANQIRPY